MEGEELHGSTLRGKKGFSSMRGETSCETELRDSFMWCRIKCKIFGGSNFYTNVPSHQGHTVLSESRAGQQTSCGCVSSFSRASSHGNLTGTSSFMFPSEFLYLLCVFTMSRQMLSYASELIFSLSFLFFYLTSFHPFIPSFFSSVTSSHLSFSSSLVISHLLQSSSPSSFDSAGFPPISHPLLPGLHQPAAGPLSPLSAV